jgi:hypothetical protein
MCGATIAYLGEDSGRVTLEWYRGPAIASKNRFRPLQRGVSKDETKHRPAASAPQWRDGKSVADVARGTRQHEHACPRFCAAGANLLRGFSNVAQKGRSCASKSHRGAGAAPRRTEEQELRLQLLLRKSQLLLRKSAAVAGTATAALHVGNKAWRAWRCRCMRAGLQSLCHAFAPTYGWRFQRARRGPEYRERNTCAGRRGRAVGGE